MMLRALSLAALCLLAVAVAACGGGSAAGEGDPATAVPRDTLFYADVVVRPEGDLREDALDAAGKVLRTDDPEARIRELVERAFQEAAAGELDYDRDVKPWLGERAGLWASGPGADRQPQAVLLLAATDTEKAQQAIDDVLRRSGETLRRGSHHDAEYQVAEDTAVGVVGDFVAIGTEGGMRRTIDASEGDSLAEQERYRTAVEGLEDERLAHFFADTKGLLALAEREDPAFREQMRQLRSIIPFDRFPPAAGAFMADGSRLALDITARGTCDLGRLGAFTGAASTPLLRELPAGSWAAAGSPKLGETMRVTFEQLGGAIGATVMREQVRRELGLDLERDVFSWMGDVAFFVRGTTVDTIDGGAVIQVTDEDRAADAFGKIVGALRTRANLDPQPLKLEGADAAFSMQVGGSGRPAVLARGNGRVVAAFGEGAAREGLDAGEKLGDSDVYEQATEVLGDDVEPAMLLSLPAVLSRVDATGDADPDFERVRPFLEAYTVFAMGGSVDGSTARYRIGAGLK
jgi:hypothetical protein